MSDHRAFAEVFAKLKEIFKPYANNMDVARDHKNYYQLNTRHITAI